jgi:hypothetical protein
MLTESIWNVVCSKVTITSSPAAQLRKQHGSTFEDRISELPDDLLITILGHLDTRSSAATSVLSRRWQHLWKSVPKLRFSQHDIVPQTELSRFLRAHEYVFFKPSLCSWKRRVRVNLDRRIRYDIEMLNLALSDNINLFSKVVYGLNGDMTIIFADCLTGLLTCIEHAYSLAH